MAESKLWWIFDPIACLVRQEECHQDHDDKACWWYGELPAPYYVNIHLFETEEEALSAAIDSIFSLASYYNIRLQSLRSRFYEIGVQGVSREYGRVAV